MCSGSRSAPSPRGISRALDELRATLGEEHRVGLIWKGASGAPATPSRSRTPDATRRARAHALGAVTPRRRRLPYVAAAALVVGCALGVALGTVFVSSGGAARPALGFGFLPEAGWSVVQAGAAPSSAQAAQAIAANVRLSPEDDPDGLPYATLLSLPERGVVIVATSSQWPSEYGPRHPTLRLPLRLRDAMPMEYGVQVRPGRPLAQYELRGTVDGQDVVVTVYFGSERPDRSTLAATQRQLERLVVESRPAAAGVVERALPLRSPAGAGARVIDRTQLCTTIVSGGVHEIEVSAHTGFRQDGRFQILPFARVATGRRRGSRQRPRRLARVGRGGQVRPQCEPDAQ